MSHNKISFITFTRNSASELSNLLLNVQGIVDEIIVVDGFSTDKTVHIAQTHGAKVYSRKPHGFADPDRMFALKKSNHNWILYLDTDERLGQNLKRDIHRLVHDFGDKFDAFSFSRIDIVRGHLLLGQFYTRQIRLFRKTRTLFKGLVHEMPQIDGSIFSVPSEYQIIHFPKYSLRKFVYYGYLMSMQYQELSTSSLAEKALLKFSPLSLPLFYVHFLVVDVLNRKPLNVFTLLYLWKLACYKTIVSLFMKTRSQVKKARAKVFEEKGFIQALSLQD